MYFTNEMKNIIDKDYLIIKLFCTHVYTIDEYSGFMKP